MKKELDWPWARYDKQVTPGGKHWVACCYYTEEAALKELKGREDSQAVARWNPDTMQQPLLLCED